MSLFKSREWWTVNLNENEMFDSKSLLTTTLENEKFQSILLGNHKGVLRLFSPNPDSVEGGVLYYEPSHLLLEVQLATPILQIGEGALVSGSPKTYLGVLHPRLFSVYALKKKESKETKIGVEMEIELVYQHILRHSAHSFVLGAFGGVRGRSFICIQSLDGLLSFYEQESFAFQLYLPTFLLPFNFCYLQKIDSFLFLNSSLIFDCYSYEALASAGGSNDKKIIKTWEFNLGEGILDINVVMKDTIIIVVLSERNLYGLNENGKMIFMRRLECKPVAFCSYLTEESKNLLVILAMEGGFVNFYENTDLKWSMKIDQIPVSIKRIFLSNLPGGIVLLSEDGLVRVIYIGTHPSIYLVPPLIFPDINIQKADMELKQLQKKITNNDISDPLTDDFVNIDLKINKTIGIQNDVRSCNVSLEINTQYLVSKIQILFLVEPPLMVMTPTATVLNVCDKTFVENTVYVDGSDVLSSLNFQVVVTYITSEGAIRSVQKNKTLPLELVVIDAPPVKETLHKITVATNKPVCGVDQLFRKFTTENTSTNTIGLKLPSGDTVTILAAKSSQKYRLQADSLELIPIFLEALLERLKFHFQKDPEFNMSFTGTLPLNEFFEKIKQHQELIKKKKITEEVLSKQTSQYITIQKKILTNLKNVTPKPSNLYKLLKDTSNQVKTSINELQDMEKALTLSRSYIRSISRLLLLLLELMSIKKEDLITLKSIFNPNVQDAEDQGWLEVQEAATSFLLRTLLAKSTKDQQKPNEILLEPMADASKLTKHFTSVIERVTKGTYLLERNDFEGKKETLMTIQAAYEADESFLTDEVPTTSKLLSINPKVESSALGSALPVVEEKEKTKEDDQRNIGSGASVEKPPEETEKDVQSTHESVISEDDDGIWDIKVEEMRI